MQRNVILAFCSKTALNTHILAVIELIVLAISKRFLLSLLYDTGASTYDLKLFIDGA